MDLFANGLDPFKKNKSRGLLQNTGFGKGPVYKEISSGNSGGYFLSVTAG
jgi:hypothetical protein